MELKPKFIIVCDVRNRLPYYQLAEEVEDILPIYDLSRISGPNEPVDVLTAQQRLVNLNTIGRTER